MPLAATLFTRNPKSDLHNNDFGVFGNVADRCVTDVRRVL
jgi:hypothetical protein